MLALLGSSAGLMLNCMYSLAGKDYECTAQVFFVGDSRIISEVSHHHLVGKNNSDVTRLNIKNQDVGFIPHNVSEFFPILSYFAVYSTAITEFTRDSLKGLYKLREFDAHSNKIESIDGDIFADNPLLVSIRFNDNPIKHIAYRVFDHLTSLTTLHFTTTTCINSKADLNRTTTVKLIFQLEISCPPSFEMLEAQIVSGEKLEEQITEKITPLLEAMNLLKQRVELLERGRKNKIDKSLY